MSQGEQSGDDFTESAYRRIVQSARSRYEFITHRQVDRAGDLALWRHDIDLSVHRAVAVARIEAELEAQATYFVLMHAELYNVFEVGIGQKLREIAELGHVLGLHFDPGHYREAQLNGGDLLEPMAAEKAVLEQIVERPVDVVSFHNGGHSGEVPRGVTLAGMLNASHESYRESFEYCSDSNGYWRFSSLDEVISKQSNHRIHVLTHPGWWTPEPMSPRQRVRRCIDGRARASEQWYDDVVERSGRKNVR